MKALIKKKSLLLRKVEECSEFLRGSITSVCSTCNRATCICKVKSKGKAYRLTYKDGKQKTRTVYIPRTKLPLARRLLQNYVQRRKLTEKLLELNVALFKMQSKL